MNISARISSFFEQASIKTLQWLVWIFVGMILFFTYLSEEGWRQSVVYSIFNCTFYALLIYSNILFLYPRLYQRGQKILYILSAVLLILGLGVIRGFIYWKIYITWFSMGHKTKLSSTIYTFIFSNLFIYVLSLVFRISFAYFGLKKQTQEILLQKSQAELNLLKSQVQPHFLFNTLNNIYYEAYRESPRTSLLIERLSEIMRYFVDESPKQKVELSTEIRFLENYMALEKIRIRYGVEFRFSMECDPSLRVPPMLLMTFIENIFKHGIDKASPVNIVDISLITRDSRLYFTTRNKFAYLQESMPGGGFGIRNLRHRLQLLYGEDFTLDTRTEDQVYFVASLAIPLN